MRHQDDSIDDNNVYRPGQFGEKSRNLIVHGSPAQFYVCVVTARRLGLEEEVDGTQDHTSVDKGRGNDVAALKNVKNYRM